jgi:diamine N-acetyltransferase
LQFCNSPKNQASSNFNDVKVSIRKATITDAKTVSEIGRRTFYETWKSVNTEEDLQLYMDKSFDNHKIGIEIENSEVNTFLLAIVGGEVAGYVKLRNDRTYDQLKEFRSLEMERIYVLKEFQDRKVGKALMDESLIIAQNGNYKWLWLGVNGENFKAIDFYKRYGFEVFGTKQFILGTAVDEDFLMKRLVKSES